MTKKCCKCDQPFTTPGIRCEECREKAAPKIPKLSRRLPFFPPELGFVLAAIAGRKK